VLYHICHKVVSVLQEWFLYYVLYPAQNTGTIPVEQKQPYNKYDIAHNTGTIPVEQNICHKVVSVLQEWFLYSVLYHICNNVVLYVFIEISQ
jgi:hypothetical protein